MTDVRETRIAREYNERRLEKEKYLEGYQEQQVRREKKERR